MDKACHNSTHGPALTHTTAFTLEVAGFFPIPCTVPCLLISCLEELPHDVHGEKGIIKSRPGLLVCRRGFC
ncbi:hypothetical protein MKW98_006774 [Papaver atlanticum]|uniref:Uncharacterized protein n=1 Tax=Papaver atlanticum TaxID=357466 RepID=A0AAD4T0P1_9MAGN|nr:hypothetical protein MKW98_006774 [Papaver atlanticum]